MVETAQSEPRKRRLKIRPKHIIIGAICIPILAFAIFRISAALQVKMKLDAIRAEGLPVTLAELDEWHPHPPTGEDAAHIIKNVQRKRIDYTVRTPRWTPGSVFREDAKIENDWQSFKEIQFDDRGRVAILGEPLSANRLDTLSDIVDESGAALALLHDAATLNTYRPPIKLAPGTGLPLPHLFTIRQRAIVLRCEALLAAERWNPEGSARAIASLFALGHSLATEPILLTQFVRMRCTHMACGTLEHVLNRIVFSDEELVQLATAVAVAEDITATQRAMVGERCGGISIFQKPNAFSLVDRSGGKQKKRNAARYRVSGRKDLDFNAYLKIMNLYVEQSERPFPERLFMNDEVKRAIARLPKYCVLTRKMTPELGTAFHKDCQNIAIVRCAMLALAIERYRLAHTRLPKNLEELVPEFIESIPLDPFDGKQLRFKKQEKGYIVYSIGINQVDDGGIVSDTESDSENPAPPLDLAFTVVR